MTENSQTSQSEFDLSEFRNILSERELGVLYSMLAGKTTSQMSVALAISKSAAKGTRAKLHSMFGTHTIGELKDRLQQFKRQSNAACVA